MNTSTSKLPAHLIIITIFIVFFGFITANKSYAAVSFESPVLYDLSGESPLAIKYADYDNDGDIDIATTQHAPAEESPEDEGVYIHLNDGDGNFTLGNHAHFTGQPQFLISADFDNDNDIDLAALNTVADDIAILLNDGNGNFTVDSIVQSGFPFLHGMTVVDFDRDNNTDIAITASNEEVETVVVLFKNDGVANFEQATILHTQHPPRGSDGPIFVKDLNGDSIDDIVVVTGDMHIFFNNGDSTFTYQQNELPPHGYITTLTPIDVDNDGDLDMLAYQNGIFSTLINIRDGIFYPDGETIFVPGQILDIPTILGSYTTADLDNDGDFDITIKDSEGELYIYLQNNINDFILLEPINIAYLNDGDPITSADFNNDGKNDLIVLVRESESGNTFHIFLQTSVENQQPVLSPIGNQVVNEGATLSFTVNATDPDGNTLTYTANNLPPGATFDPTTHVFSWAPGYSDAGNYPDIEFSVMDNGTPMELAVELITITVGDVNRAPILTNPGPQEVLENTALSFSLSATDPDGDGTEIIATNMPSGAVFNGTTFNWTPTLSQAGVYTISFTATDTGAPVESAFIEVVITVGDSPTPTEQAVALVNTVVALPLTQSTENSYLANLQKVEQFILDGKIQAALNQLNAFVTKVQTDYQHGVITLQVRDNLVQFAQKLIEDITN